MPKFNQNMQIICQLIYALWQFVFHKVYFRKWEDSLSNNCN